MLNDFAFLADGLWLGGGVGEVDEGIGVATNWAFFIHLQPGENAMVMKLMLAS